MPISKIYLPDVNIWLALVFEGHAHHRVSVEWFNASVGPVAFCRVTQVGLLRLLTNRKVMGDEVLTTEQAWTAYSHLHQDLGVTFLNEPNGLEERWRTATLQRDPVTHSWTDAYLLAFAKARDATLVSLDQAFKTDPTAIILA